MRSSPIARRPAAPQPDTMEIFGLTPWEWILPILIGVTAGLATNAIAIWMLFHPYQPVRLGRLRLMPEGCVTTRALPEGAWAIPEICQPTSAPFHRLPSPPTVGSS